MMMMMMGTMKRVDHVNDWVCLKSIRDGASGAMSSCKMVSISLSAATREDLGISGVMKLGKRVLWLVGRGRAGRVNGDPMLLFGKMVWPVEDSNLHAAEKVKQPAPLMSNFPSGQGRPCLFFLMFTQVALMTVGWKTEKQVKLPRVWKKGLVENVST